MSTRLPDLGLLQGARRVPVAQRPARGRPRRISPSTSCATLCEAKHVIYEIVKPGRAGVCLVLTPLELMERLAALIPATAPAGCWTSGISHSFVRPRMALVGRTRPFRRNGVRRKRGVSDQISVRNSLNYTAISQFFGRCFEVQPEPPIHLFARVRG